MGFRMLAGKVWVSEQLVNVSHKFCKSTWERISQYFVSSFHHHSTDFHVFSAIQKFYYEAYFLFTRFTTESISLKLAALFGFADTCFERYFRCTHRAVSQHQVLIWGLKSVHKDDAGASESSFSPTTIIHTIPRNHETLLSSLIRPVWYHHAATLSAFCLLISSSLLTIPRASVITLWQEFQVGRAPDSVVVMELG